MRYFLKIIGCTKETDCVFDAAVEKRGELYWTPTSRIYFGKMRPKDFAIGDTLILTVPQGQLCDKPGRILGYYERTSEFKYQPITINYETNKPKSWDYYVDIKNLNVDFSVRSRTKDLLDMRTERDNIDYPYGKITAGWAYLSDKDGRYLIDKINNS
jgi:hypothetical protein